MCDRLPGNRCANHVNKLVDKKKQKIMQILLNANVESSNDLTGRARADYEFAQDELHSAEIEMTRTLSGIKNMTEQAKESRRIGDTDYAAKLEDDVYEAKAIRRRRKEGLNKLKRAESFIQHQIKSNKYQDEAGSQAKKDVTEKLKQAMAEGTGDKDVLALNAANAEIVKHRYQSVRLKTAREKLDKEFSEAIDDEDSVRSDAALTRIEQNMLRQNFISIREQKFDEESARLQFGAAPSFV